jgi:hypothetical protein
MRITDRRLFEIVDHTDRRVELELHDCSALNHRRGDRYTDDLVSDLPFGQLGWRKRQQSFRPKHPPDLDYRVS